MHPTTMQQPRRWWAIALLCGPLFTLEVGALECTVKEGSKKEGAVYTDVDFPTSPGDMALLMTSNGFSSETEAEQCCGQSNLFGDDFQCKNEGSWRYCQGMAMAGQKAENTACCKSAQGCQDNYIIDRGLDQLRDYSIVSFSFDLLSVFPVAFMKLGFMNEDDKPSDLSWTIWSGIGVVFAVIELGMEVAQYYILTDDKLPRRVRNWSSAECMDTGERFKTNDLVDDAADDLEETRMFVETQIGITVLQSILEIFCVFMPGGEVSKPAIVFTEFLIDGLSCAIAGVELFNFVLPAADSAKKLLKVMRTAQPGTRGRYIPCVFSCCWPETYVAP